MANAYPWQLKQSNLDREFRDLIYDPAADPQAVAAELRQINRTDFTKVLKQKGLLSQAQIRSTANLLDAIRLEVIATAEAAQAREKSIELMAEVEEYLTTVSKDSLTPEKIQLEFKPILEDFDATSETMMRVESAKKQAAQQVEDTRKAAATASWWLFITGLVSAIASAAAGAIGVVG